MSVIYANPVGVFVGTFREVLPTKNPSWLMAIFALNTDTGHDVRESFLISTKDQDLFNQVKACEKDKVYRLTLGATVEKSRHDESTGRDYPARFRGKLIKISS